MKRAEQAARTLDYRSDFRGWMEVAGRGEYRLKLAAIRDLAFELGGRTQVSLQSVDHSGFRYHLIPLTAYVRLNFDDSRDSLSEIQS